MGLLVDIFDKNGNGCLELSELAQLLERYTALCKQPEPSLDMVSALAINLTSNT